MRRRLNLARALADRPKLIFLDEPTTGLDPRSRLAISEVMRERVREGTTILLTTQYLEEADEFAHAIAVVDSGRIIARGTSDHLKSQIGGERIEVVVHDRDRIADAIAVLTPIGEGKLAFEVTAFSVGDTLLRNTMVITFVPVEGTETRDELENALQNRALFVDASALNNAA